MVPARGLLILAPPKLMCRAQLYGWQSSASSSALSRLRSPCLTGSRVRSPGARRRCLCRLNTFPATRRVSQPRRTLSRLSRSFLVSILQSGKLAWLYLEAAIATLRKPSPSTTTAGPPKTLPVKFSEVVRIFGLFHFTLDRSQSYHHLLTEKRNQLACAAMATSIRSCLTRAAYTGPFGAWNHTDLQALETLLNVCVLFF